jgi:hypothetical protein
MNSRTEDHLDCIEKDHELCLQSVVVVKNVTACINMNGSKTWKEVSLEDVILLLLF